MFKVAIVAFQIVIHKSIALYKRAIQGRVFCTFFGGSLQDKHNTEIILGFPECVQGDKPRAKL